MELVRREDHHEVTLGCGVAGQPRAAVGLRLATLAERPQAYDDVYAESLRLSAWACPGSVAMIATVLPSGV